MTFKVTTSLKKIAKSKARTTVCKSGTNTGKSYCIIALLIDYATKNKRKNILCVAETVPSVKLGALAIFKDIMMDTGRWFEDHYNATDMTYTFSTVTKIMFKAFDTVGKAKAAGKRDILFVNEGNHIAWPIVNELLIRTSDKIYIDYNPSSESWIDTEILTQKENVDEIHLMYSDNEAISPNIVKELELRKELAKTSSYWKNWVDVMVYGRIGTQEGAIFTDWSLANKIPEDAKFIGYGMDFGYNDPTTLNAVYKYNNELYIEELIYKSNLTVTDLIKEFGKLNINKTYEIFADSANPGTIEEIRRSGYNIKSVKKGLIVNGIETMQRYKIYITKNSLNTIKEFRNYKWDIDKDGKVLNKPIDFYNHSIDAIRYLVISKLGISKSGVYNLISI